MEGRLVVLPRDGVHKAALFVSGTARRCILVVGSQSESLFSTPYVEEIVETVKGEWAVAQVTLGSSIVGRGIVDHEADADDVDAAVATLVKDHQMEEITLYASGTGVQVAIEVMSSAAHAHLVTRVVLHGGIVNPQRSTLFTPEATKQRIEKAHALVAEKCGDDTTAMAAVYDIAITPARLHRNAVLTIQEVLWLPAVGGAGGAGAAAAANSASCRSTLRGLAVPTLFLVSTEASYNKTAEAAVPAVQRAAREAIGLPAEEVQVSLLPATVDEHRRFLRGNGPLAAQTVYDFLQRADQRREQRKVAAAADAVETERKKRVELAKALCA